MASALEGVDGAPASAVVPTQRKIVRAPLPTHACVKDAGTYLWLFTNNIKMPDLHTHMTCAPEHTRRDDGTGEQAQAGLTGARCR